ncbi:hypothetical protein EVAR_103528_1 [Eumeta japonica]|uniref:Uncharacterized protein n=1 Tax=Eumeta variegata TaxID=151549 RepID=A0A4C1YW06_EUMVA|nr:hypothetical protein EVAR_103528_1 [Eumeta japonica]
MYSFFVHEKWLRRTRPLPGPYFKGRIKRQLTSDREQSVTRFSFLIKMFTAIILLAVAGSITAAPSLFLAHQEPVAILSSKSTITKSSHLVNHGSTVVHAPVLPVVHAAAVPVVHAPVVPVVHAPLVHGPVVHGLTHVVVKSSPAAVSHSSSTSHHTEFEPVHFVALHH